MVKIGFIVEGDSEKIIIESKRFSAFLQRNNFELVRPVINARGGGNLLPQNVGVFIQALKKQAVEKICVQRNRAGGCSLDQLNIPLIPITSTR